MMDRTSPDVIKEAVEAGSVKVISNASLATEPVSPNIKKNTMLAAAVGFVLVMVCNAVVRKIDPESSLF